MKQWQKLCSASSTCSRNQKSHAREFESLTDILLLHKGQDQPRYAEEKAPSCLCHAARCCREPGRAVTSKGPAALLAGSWLPLLSTLIAATAPRDTAPSADQHQGTALEGQQKNKTKKRGSEPGKGFPRHLGRLHPKDTFAVCVPQPGAAHCSHNCYTAQQQLKITPTTRATCKIGHAGFWSYWDMAWYGQLPSQVTHEMHS